MVRAGEATHGNIISRMRFAPWITKATYTHSEYVIHIALNGNSGLRLHGALPPCICL
jgi:hypothetical protein